MDQKRTLLSYIHPCKFLIKKYILFVFETLPSINVHGAYVYGCLSTSFIHFSSCFPSDPVLNVCRLSLEK